MNVTKRFDKLLALDRLTFDVESGEYVCVLGPTGSGKTTLLRLIAGLLNPDDGTIFFDGRSVNTLEAHDRNAVVSRPRPRTQRAPGRALAQPRV